MLDHREHTPQLLLGIKRRGTRPGGFSADVDDVRAIGRHLQRVLHRARSVEAETAI